MYSPWRNWNHFSLLLMEDRKCVCVLSRVNNPPECATGMGLWDGVIRDVCHFWAGLVSFRRRGPPRKHTSPTRDVNYDVQHGFRRPRSCK